MSKICSIKGCDKFHSGRGFCNIHYMRWYRNNITKICSIEGCLKIQDSRGWCCTHYTIWRRHGNPNYKKLTLYERFNNSYIKDTNGCWIWQKSKIYSGYGYFSINSKMKLAHRVSWNLFCGKISDNLNVLHKCDNPPCVNPDHLFLGSYKDNMDDMRNKGREPDMKGEKQWEYMIFYPTANK